MLCALKDSVRWKIRFLCFAWKWAQTGSGWFRALVSMGTISASACATFTSPFCFMERQPAPQPFVFPTLFLPLQSLPPPTPPALNPMDSCLSLTVQGPGARAHPGPRSRRLGLPPGAEHRFTALVYSEQQVLGRAGRGSTRE